MRLTRRAVALAVAVALAGCGDGGSGDSGSAGAGSETDQAPVENFAQPAELLIETEGEVTTHFEGSAELNVLRADAPGGERLVTVGTMKGVEGGDGWFIHEAFVNIVGYTGDGDYEVAAAGQEGGTPKLANSAYAVITRGPAGQLEGGRFDEPAGTCTVHLEREGLEGELTCSSLATSDGRTISIRMTWRGEGEPRNLLPDDMQGSSG